MTKELLKREVFGFIVTNNSQKNNYLGEKLFLLKKVLNKIRD